MRKFYFLLIILSLSVSRLLAQSGSLQGKVTDVKTKEGVPFAAVILLQNGILVTGNVTDINGNYAIKPIVPGTYDLKVVQLGDTVILKGIIVHADQLTFQNVETGGVTKLKEFIVRDNPLKPDVVTGSQHSGVDIQHLAIDRSNPVNVAALTGGVAQSDVNQGLNINGSRSYSQKYVIDGIPVTGTLGLPSDAIDQLTVLTGGIPARYGDATGGVITITTRGPSRDFHGGIEAASSYVVDVDHYRLITADLSGPLFTKNKKSKGTEHDSSDTKLGFFISAEYEGNDGGKSAVGYYKTTSSFLDSIQKFPLKPAPFGQGYVPSAAYVSQSDLQKINLIPNNSNNTYRFNGKVDYKLNNYIDLKIGGRVDVNQSNGTGLTQMLFDPTVTSYSSANTYSGYARFTQRFGSGRTAEQQSSSVFQNAYYSIQVDYTKFYEKFDDPTKGFNPFLYGYIGQFKTYRQPVYALGSDTLTDGKGHYIMNSNGTYKILTGQLLLGYRDTLVTFRPSDVNQLMANYTTQYYTLSGSNPVDGVYGIKNTDGLSYFDAETTGDVGGQFNHYSTLSQIQSTGGLINGEAPPTVYSMWNNTGSPVGGYGIVNNDQYHLAFYGSVDVVNSSGSGKKDQNRHALEFGIDYQQNVDRSYSVSPIGLWTLATQLANSHIQNLDTRNPVPVYRNGVFQDTINYNRLVGSQQNYFDKSLREKLGLQVNGTDFIDVNSLDPSVLALNMFSPDELLGYVSEAGYNYTGSIYTKQPSFNDYFTQQDANGNFMRPVAAFRPIYAAAYLQDNFSFRDLVFNVGVRVDRYDANEQVLKDPYLLYPARTAGEVTQLNGQKVSIPSTIGSNYVVYVNDLQNPTQIVGYRNGNVWYDATGTVTTNPATIAAATATGKITPYLVNNTTDSLAVNGDAFTSYTPQFTVMPRIKFSFTLSDQALFFAHYDVYSQRPTQNQSSPADYYWLKQLSVDETINNPDLLPEVTIDYQAGFKQKLGANSVLTISGLYRELKNLVQIQKYSYAFPVDYTTYGNSDFGTVKSLILEYEMRRTNNLSLDINYTLSFADGTGDSQSSAAGLVNVGETVKPVFPFSYDRRHTITGSFDYRYADGQYYNGPVLGKNSTQVLANTGLDVILTTFSGTPYSRQANPTPTVLSGVATTSTALGTIHGSRLPWTFRIDMKLDKDFKVGKKKDGKLAHYINVYVLIQNLLNTQNILSVYQYTGNPSNDGYLTSPAGQQSISSQVDPQAFTNLYNIRVNAPGNYSQPRVTRVGLSYRF